MCTLVARIAPGSAWPLVVAANRDERLARPASPMRLWPGPIPFLAPVDEQAHGTWLGINARGLFVGVTNRFGVPRDESRRSRGQLVVDALAAESAFALHRQLASLAPDAFNAFHLCYADASRGFVTWSDGTRLEQQALSPGLHVVTERSLGGDDRARTERVRAFWEAHVSEPPREDALAALMRQHSSDDPLAATCVHVPALGYGTRSSMLFFRAPTLADSRLLFAPESPCRSDYRPVPLAELTGHEGAASRAPTRGG